MQHCSRRFGSAEAVAVDRTALAETAASGSGSALTDAAAAPARSLDASSSHATVAPTRSPPTAHARRRCTSRTVVRLAKLGYPELYLTIVSQPNSTSTPPPPLVT